MHKVSVPISVHCCRYKCRPLFAALDLFGNSAPQHVCESNCINILGGGLVLTAIINYLYFINLLLNVNIILVFILHNYSVMYIR